MPTPDVSQFIQMNRLRSLESRTPKKSDRSLVEFYQPKLTVVNEKDFLPSFTNKFTDPLTIKRRYIPRLLKPTVPTRNSY